MKRKTYLQLEQLQSRCVPSSVSVLDFGARGDGRTNDQPAIQAAIDSLAPTGGTVQVPAGTYALGGRITIPTSNITFQGTGSHSILRLLPGVNDTQIVIGTPSFAGNISGDSVQNLVLDGNHNAGYFFGIAMQQGSNMSFSGLTVENESEDGIYIGNSGALVSRNITVSFCTIKNCNRNGIDVGFADGVTIVNNTFVNTPVTAARQGGSPIDIEPEAAVATPYVKNVLIERNKLEITRLSFPRGGISRIPYYGPITNVTILRNILTKFGRYGR